MQNEKTSPILKGTPVMLNNDGKLLLRLGSNPIYLMFGVTVEDIQPSKNRHDKNKWVFSRERFRVYLLLKGTGLVLNQANLLK